MLYRTYENSHEVGRFFSCKLDHNGKNYRPPKTFVASISHSAKFPILKIVLDIEGNYIKKQLQSLPKMKQ